MKRDGTSSGVALVLVLTIILALAVIATPFVLSMGKQESTAATEKAERQADYGAEGARNFAAATLLRGMDPGERREPVGLWNTPYSDEEREFAIDLRDARLKELKVLDVQGSIWGISAEDEQGKINIRTAPKRVMDNLKTLVDARIVDLKDYVTEYTPREAHWIYPQRVRGVIEVPDASGALVRVLAVDNAVHYGDGARIRFARPGAEQPAIVAKNPGPGIIPDIGVDAAAAFQVVEVEARYPLNLNTARVETIAAVLEGVRIEITPQLKDEITREEARAIAAALKQQIFSSWRELAAFVAAQTWTDLDKLTVVLNFTDPTNLLLRGTGTVPACFVSHDAVTVKARTVRNTEAGTPASDTGYREVVDLGPPVPVIWIQESQEDFERPFNGVFFAANELAMNPVKKMMAGFPGGNRFVTFPEKYPNVIDRTLKPQAAEKEAYLQLDSAIDVRGSALFNADHFNMEVEGKKLKGGTQTYPWVQALPETTGPAVGAGGFEMWVRVDKIEPITFFDIRESDMMNRISLEIDGGDLVLKVTDAAADPANKFVKLTKGLAEVRYPFVPIADTWYHIGAYWSGTRWSQLALLVDGFSDPKSKFRHTDLDGKETITELGAALAKPPPPPQQQVSAVSLQDDSWIPSPPASERAPVEPEPNTTPLMIGDEVIHYDKGSRLAWRGQRGTPMRDHPAGAKVQLFGYSSLLEPVTLQISIASPPVTLQFGRLPKTTGRVRLPFGAAAGAAVVGTVSDPDPPFGMYVDEKQTEIPAIGHMGDFPAQGYILIDDEVIYYTGVQPDKFLGCMRGQQGTPPARHDNGAMVTLWCIPITDAGGYLSPSLVQIGEEWFGPVKPDTERTGFLVGVVVPGYQVGGVIHVIRGGVFGSRNTEHRAGEDVVPIFAVAETERKRSRENCQRWDVVTLMDAENNRTVGRVRRAANPMQWNANPSLSGSGSQGVTQLVALWSHVPQDYVPDGQHVRVLKWPSGELIGLSWLKKANPPFTIGPGPITIDEVKFLHLDTEFPDALGAPIDKLAKEFPVDPLPQTKQGAIKIGDEIIGFVERGEPPNSVLKKCRRGWLNSEAQVHAQGEIVQYMTYLPIDRLTEDCGARDQKFDGAGGVQMNPVGYVLIDKEVLGYDAIDAKNDGGVRYDCLKDFGGQGLWRGRFGTQAASHGKDALVYGIPFRYWDTYRPQMFDNRMAYHQASFARRGARWRTLKWVEQMPADDPLVRTHCWVRADGAGEFFDAPAQDDRTLLWEFLAPNVANRIDHIARLRDAGQLDVRFLVEFQGGAYWPEHAWKRSPRIKQVEVEYDRPTRVVFHEDE